jgi:hypothetical protein
MVPVFCFATHALGNTYDGFSNYTGNFAHCSKPHTVLQQGVKYSLTHAQEMNDSFSTEEDFGQRCDIKASR